MRFSLIFPTYLIWHYSTAFTDIRRLQKNITWFIYHFFSVELLLKTLFMPFRRLSGSEVEKKESVFDKIVINVVMRIVGFFVRFAVVLIGVFFVCLVNILFIGFYLVWLFLPLLIPVLFLLGLGFFI